MWRRIQNHSGTETRMNFESKRKDRRDRRSVMTEIYETEI